MTLLSTINTTVYNSLLFSISIRLGPWFCSSSLYSQYWFIIFSCLIWMCASGRRAPRSAPSRAATLHSRFPGSTWELSTSFLQPKARHLFTHLPCPFSTITNLQSYSPFQHGLAHRMQRGSRSCIGYSCSMTRNADEEKTWVKVSRAKCLLADTSICRAKSIHLSLKFPHM